MKIFCISGLGADTTVFDFLKLDHEIIPIEWITPQHREGLKKYSERLIRQNDIPNNSEIALLGVSFGGLVAVEISQLVNPKFTILISSVESQNDINWILKFIGKLKIDHWIPSRFFIPPKFIAHYLFGAKNKVLLNSILDNTDVFFTKWAIRELLNWQNKASIPHSIKINGSKDKLFVPKGEKNIVIEGGGHFMIVDRADEISSIINNSLKTQATNEADAPLVKRETKENDQ